MYLPRAAALIVAFPLLAGYVVVAAHTKPTGITYTRDIEPLLEKKCLNCHVSGGPAPIWLDTFARARNWSRAIRQEVLLGRMPPWNAATGYAEFSNDPRLTPVEIELLTAWVDGGTPLGLATPKRASASPDEHIADLSLEVSSERRADSLERTQFVTRFPSSRQISAWTFRPASGVQVQEATLWVGKEQVGAWTSLDTVVRYPPGVGYTLPPGAVVGIEVSYREPSPGRDLRGGRMDVYFDSEARATVEHRNLQCAENVIDRDIEAISLSLTSQAAHRPIEVVARRRDGSVEPLLVIADYDPRYPAGYRFRTPIRMPAGTRVGLRSAVAGCAGRLDFIAAPRRTQAR